MSKFEEYKLFVEDTAKFTDRRQQVSNMYLTVNSIILTAMAFLVKDAQLVEFWRLLVVMVVLGVGIYVCGLWKQLIYKYKLLVNHRISELREIEKHLDMAGCHKMYHTEDKLYPRDENGEMIKGQGLNISDKEKWLPNIFGSVYGLFLIVIVVYLFLQ